MWPLSSRGLIWKFIAKQDTERKFLKYLRKNHFIWFKPFVSSLCQRVETAYLAGTSSVGTDCSRCILGTGVMFDGKLSIPSTRQHLSKDEPDVCKVWLLGMECLWGVFCSSLSQASFSWGNLRALHSSENQMTRNSDLFTHFASFSGITECKSKHQWFPCCCVGRWGLSPCCCVAQWGLSLCLHFKASC